MNKNKILKVLLIIIFVLFFLIGCFAIYKFVIINKIFNKMAEYVTLENYCMKITDIEDESETTEVYYKDGIGKMIMSTGVYSWTDGKDAYLVNDEKKQIQKLEMDSSLLISNEYVGSIVPGYSKNILGKFMLAGNISTSVKVKKYDSIKYYMVTTNENKMEKVIWFQYNTLIPTQVNIQIGEIKKSYIYDISFEKVTNEDVKKPNLEAYTIIEE